MNGVVPLVGDKVHMLKLVGGVGVGGVGSDVIVGESVVVGVGVEARAKKHALIIKNNNIVVSRHVVFVFIGVTTFKFERLRLT